MTFPAATPEITRATLWNHFVATGIPHNWLELDMTGLRVFVHDYAGYIAYYVGDAKLLDVENEAIALHGKTPAKTYRIPPLTVEAYFKIWLERVRS